MPAFAFCLLVILISCGTDSEELAARSKRSFDADWRFSRDSISGAEQPSYDDSKWRVLDLPHDWSIEDTP